jgi:exopolysaccharide biosynthesis WecB/TagA/CpsF family protein
MTEEPGLRIAWIIDRLPNDVDNLLRVRGRLIEDGFQVELVTVDQRGRLAGIKNIIQHDSHATWPARVRTLWRHAVSADLIHVMGHGPARQWLSVLRWTHGKTMLFDDGTVSLTDSIGGHYRRRLGVDERTILGVTLQVTSQAKAVRRIDDAIATRAPMNVAFANAHTLNLAATSVEFRHALKSFFVLNDGLGVDLASRWTVGRAFSENLNGTDFVPHCLNSSRHSLRIFLLGSTADVAESAAKRIVERWPRHTIAGTRHGFFANAEDESEAAAMIRASRADLVLVGMGNPLQELWIANHGAQTGAPVLLGVGAFLDFTSGRIQRAPQWVRDLRCEWIWRFVREPRRLWRRYLLGNMLFVVRVLRGGRMTGFQ